MMKNEGMIRKGQRGGRIQCRSGMRQWCELVGAAVVLALLVLDCAWSVEAHQLHLVHGYSHLSGSSASQGGKGATPDYYATLRAHDRRRLANVVDFPLTGDDNPFVTGLYYTEISLGTPASTYYVQVDTGSDVLWVNCYPCTDCPTKSSLGITLNIYNPSKSSTAAGLACSDSECKTAADGAGATCNSNELCSYSTLYGDGSSTNGYFVNDVLTYKEVVGANTTNATGSAKVYFGCGNNQTGSLTSTSRALDGLMGFGQADISVPSQLAAQNKTGKVFAHCLQGDDQGSGTLVIGNILETNLSYTPIVPGQSHYNVGLQNIAISGVNVTSPTSFEITNTGGGVIFDSGTTLSYLTQPAYDSFLAAVESAAPVQAQQLSDGAGSTQTCFVYSGSINGSFADVVLYFSGGVEMVLGPASYLFKESLSNGETAWCMGWLESSSQAGYQSYSIFGDNTLKDQLIVYDNELRRIGWKPFDCTQPISVSSSNGSPMSVEPGSPSTSTNSSDARTNRGSLLIWFIALMISYTLL